jgi:hypothetical protein
MEDCRVLSKGMYFKQSTVNTQPVDDKARMWQQAMAAMEGSMDAAAAGPGGAVPPSSPAAADAWRVVDEAEQDWDDGDVPLASL